MRAIPGEWWRSAKGALYCVIGPEITPGGLGAWVRVFWITGHTPPQLQRTRLYPYAWRAIAKKGERLAGRPVANHHGTDVRDLVAEAERRLAEGT